VGAATLQGVGTVVCTHTRLCPYDTAPPQKYGGAKPRVEATLDKGSVTAPCCAKFAAHGPLHGVCRTGRARLTAVTVNRA
jgi:hypothetical protein